MLLSIAERILLLNVLPPAEGDLLFLRAIRTFRDALGFSEEEAAALKLVQNDLHVSWDPAQNPMKEIEIGPSVARYVSRSILKASALKEEHLDFYSRFIDEPPQL